MIEIRKTAPEEFRAASATVGTALLHAPASDDDWAKASVLPSWEGSDSLSAWDGDRCVGHASGFRFDTLVPGGAWLPTNGVTRVGVLGTHRRQGLLRAMLTRLLVEGAERGQVLASLRASETPIYQRFGFGLAGEQAECRLVPGKVLPIRGTASGIVPPAADRRDHRHRQTDLRARRHPARRHLPSGLDVGALLPERDRDRW